MLKNQIVFFLLLFVGTLNAQSNDFAPLGARWRMDFAERNNQPQFYQVETTGDTTIAGQDCRHLEQHFYRFDGRIEKQHDFYTYEQNDSVFLYNTEYELFILIYDFSAEVGDTVTLGDEHPDFETFHFLVTEKEPFDEVEGEGVNQFTWRLLNEDLDDFYYEELTVIEKIGNYDHPIFIFGALSNSISRFALYCYEDEVTSYKSSSSRDCDAWTPLGGAAVEWAPLFSTWYYITSIENKENLVSAFVEKDTMINNQACNKIVIRYYADGNDDQQGIEFLYTYERNDSAFYYNDHYDDFVLLYDFTLSAGDTLRIPNPDPEILPELDTINIPILEVRMDTIPSGQPVRFFVTDDSEYGGTFYGGYYENIGSAGSILLPEAGNRITWFNVRLNCYHDGTQFYRFRDASGCLVPIENLTESTDWSIYPTLIGNDQPLTIEKNTPAKVAHQLTIRDLTGKMIYQSELSRFTNEWEINALNNMPQGVYLVSIANAVQRLTLRVIKI